MANFDTPVQKTNDPNYTGSSQGTSAASLQPLAEVPRLETRYFKPDYEANKSAGIGIAGAGGIAEAGAKLTDQVIQQKADDTLSKGIDQIRDSFGVAQAADQSSGIASAVGQGGAEGVSLTNSQPDQPVALNRLGAKVSGLTEAYNQGGLSNSAYYAKLEAFVRETKAQFPGYSDQIDSMVSTKVGTTPANALRASLLQDVTNLANKVQSQNDKWTTYEHTNTQYIHTQWPNYEQLKADGKAPDRLTVEAAVGKMQARDYSLDSGMKALAVRKEQNSATSDTAYDLAIQKASHISRDLVIGVTNTMGINSITDLRQYMQDVQTGKRPQPSADDLQKLTGYASILYQKASAQFQQFANQPLAANTTETLASKLRDPTKLQQAQDVALSDIKTIFDGLTNEQHGLVGATVAWNKADDAIADQTLAQKMPNSQIVGALHRKIGDQPLAQLFTDANLGTDLAVGLRRLGWQSADQQEPVEQTLGTLSKADPTGVASKQHIKDATNFVIHQHELADPTLGDHAFKSLFGEGNRTLIDAFNSNPKAQVGIYSDMVSPQMVKAVAKRSPADRPQFVQWAEDGFASVFQTQAMGANQSAQNFKVNGNLSLKFDPDSQSFKFEGGSKLPLMGGKAPQRTVDVANQTLAPLNAALTTVKEVFKLTGKDPTAELYRLLPTAGIEPGSPIYKAIQEEFIKKNPPKEG